MAMIVTFTGEPANTRDGTITTNEANACGAMTVVRDVPVNGDSLSEVTVTDCGPAVVRVTGNDARPLAKTTSTIGRFAAVSLLATVAEPPNEGTGRPWASTATAVTHVGTPALTWAGIKTVNFVATSAGATTVEAEAERVGSAESLTVRVCAPDVRKVTGTNALPLTSVTDFGNAAAASEDDTATEPEKPKTGVPAASTAAMRAIVGMPLGTEAGNVTLSAVTSAVAATGGGGPRFSGALIR